MANDLYYDRILDMKTLLFCNLPYSFSILKPLADELKNRDYNYLWYIPSSLIKIFPYLHMPHTQTIKELEEFQSDAIFVAGNDVPYWLRGAKVQIFHGLAGEKKGHFRIRDYFDLYLTQGPYFTNRFKTLSLKHKNFDVIETGWCKLDNLYTISNKIKTKKTELLNSCNAKKIILYAPTFSPSLTSGLALLDTIEKLTLRDDILVIIKFHDKMATDIKEKYQQLETKNLIISDEKDITTLLQISDIMISDTSSVVYEFTFLNKPVVTLNSKSENINWCNVGSMEEVYSNTIEILNGNDSYTQNRKNSIELYHPYSDGKSSIRMIEATKAYIKEQGVPEKRKLSLLRKFKILKKYGKLF